VDDRKKATSKNQQKIGRAAIENKFANLPSADKVSELLAIDRPYPS